MDLQLIAGGHLTVDDRVFACDFNEGLVHQVVVSYLATGRSGTKAQKNRSAVRGGGAKPWRQKGGGRARAGTIRSPLWRGGGVTFAANPRSYAKKVNRKMYRKALASIISELVRQERFFVVEFISVDAMKTKQAIALIDNWGLAKKNVLLVTLERDNMLYFAVRNLRHVDLYSVDQINPVTLLASENVVVSIDAVKKIEGWLS